MPGAENECGLQNKTAYEVNEQVERLNTLAEEDVDRQLEEFAVALCQGSPRLGRVYDFLLLAQSR